MSLYLSVNIKLFYKQSLLVVYLGKKTSQLRMKTALRTDERVRLMNEVKYFNLHKDL